MNRDIRRLLAELGPARSRLPAYDEPLGAEDARCDRLAQELLAVDAGVAPALAQRLSNRQRTLLYRCSVRAAGRAVAVHSQDLCLRGLVLALVALSDQDDPRELMIDLTPHHVAAASVAASAQVIFDRADDRCPLGLRDTLRIFGARADVTLDAFGWGTSTGAAGAWVFPTGW